MRLQSPVSNDLNGSRRGFESWSGGNPVDHSTTTMVQERPHFTLHLRRLKSTAWLKDLPVNHSFLISNQLIRFSQAVSNRSLTLDNAKYDKSI